MHRQFLTPAQRARAKITAVRKERRLSESTTAGASTVPVPAGAPGTSVPEASVSTAPVAAGKKKKRKLAPNVASLDVPEPWGDLKDIPTVAGLVGHVPQKVVDMMYDRVLERAKEAARAKKLLLREELKLKAVEQRGTPSEISSRREAKVSRKYMMELRTAVEDELKEALRQNALLWAVFKHLKTDIERDPRADEGPSTKRQRVD